MQRFLARRSTVVTLASCSAALSTLMGGCPASPDMDTLTGGVAPGGSTAMLPGAGGAPSAGAPGAPAAPANAAPAIDAGPDFGVWAGDTVHLNVAASDPDGDAITIQWTQLSGPTVALSDPASDAPTFAAPSASAMIEFQVSVSDGEATTSDIVAITVSVHPVLYVANYTSGGVVSFLSPATLNGNVAPDTNLFGAATGLVNPSDIVIDAAGALIVSDATPAIHCFDDALHTNGNLAPERNVQGAATQLAMPASLAFAPSSDLLFVSNVAGAPDSIGIYADVSSAGFNGNRAPLRQITSANIVDPVGINLDAAGSLYVANFGASIAVFDDAGNRNGNLAADRLITSAAFGSPLYDAFVDAADRLFVVTMDGHVHVFEHASTLNGAVLPTSTLTIPGVALTTAIVVDAAGTGYVADYAGNRVYAYENIADRNGMFAPDRTLSGANTQFSGPIRLFLTE